MGAGAPVGAPVDGDLLVRVVVVPVGPQAGSCEAGVDDRPELVDAPPAPADPALEAPQLFEGRSAAFGDRLAVGRRQFVGLRLVGGDVVVERPDEHPVLGQLRADTRDEEALLFAACVAVGVRLDRLHRRRRGLSIAVDTAPEAQLSWSPAARAVRAACARSSPPAGVRARRAGRSANVSPCHPPHSSARHTPTDLEAYAQVLTKF